ncbi:ABC transporter substrate-binding protein [Xylophilus sp. GW821-FHT01B05]
MRDLQPHLHRRHLLGLALGAAATSALADPVPHRLAPEAETRSLDELHRAALAEGGKLVVYAGGDTADSQVALEKSFMARFPGMNARILPDLSKYHDARIDQQLARGRLECDVAHLQTLHDYDRWKSEGQLLHYKPLDWDAILPEFKDPDGAFVAIGVIAFSNVTNANLIAEADAPRDALDYLDPKLRGRLVLTYPHDDDAVLFIFDRIVAAHGWEYVDRLLKQDVQWIRGTAPARLVVRDGKKAASFTVSAPLVQASGSPLRFQLPRRDVFQSWGQTAAIFREAPNKAAARLYLSWMCSKEATVARTSQWSARRDVPAPGGYGAPASYNTDPQAFHRFMLDRYRIERLKTQFEEIIGPAAGANPTGANGIYLLGA